MKRDPVQLALQALAEVATRPHDEATHALVRASLGHRSNHVVGRAARIAREANLAALGPDLVAAFPRFLEDPIRRDPGCVAKAEIVHALLSFEHPAPDVFLRGAAHVQKEPGSVVPPSTRRRSSAEPAPSRWSSSNIRRRSRSASGSWSMPRPPPGRAASALSPRGAAPDVALLFRFLALRGDDEPEVLADVFAGLLALSADVAVAFVVERLASENRDIARAAAMALGEARRSEAVVALRQHFPVEQRRDVRHAIILALATSRDDAAFDALLDVVARGSPADSKAAVQALQLYRHDEALQGRVHAVLKARGVDAGTSG